MGRIRKTSNATRKPILWLIGLYIRLSKEDGNLLQDDSLSVTNQEKILKDFVKDYFEEGTYKIVGIYVDDGESGTTDYSRPDFGRLINDVETGAVNCFICKDLSRAFRNYSDQGYFLESYFPRFGTRFISTGSPRVDTYTNPEAVSGMEVPISGLMNDRYAYKTSADIRRTFDNKRRNGEFIGAFAPFGYQKNPENKNHLIIDEEAAQVVTDIFKWYVYGDGSTETVLDENGTPQEKLKGNLSKEGIARKLNELGIPNPTAYKRRKGFKYSNPQLDKNDGLWTGTGVTKILKNEVYIGHMVQGKQKVISYKVHDKVQTPPEEWYHVANTHEPIIDRKLFEVAQIMQEKDTRCAPGKRKNYLFSGFLKCADCGKSMTRRTAKNLVYYNCSTYKRKSKDKCTKHTMRLDILEKAVLATIQKQIEIVEDLSAVIDEISKAPVVDNKSTRLETLLRLRIGELEKAENIVTNLYIDWKNGDINREQYHKMKEQFELQSEQLKQVIENIKEEIEVMDRGIESDNPYLIHFLKHKNIQSLTQGLLNELVEAIHIYEGGNIKIQFKFEDQYKRIVDFINNNKYTLTVIENKAIG